MRGLALTLGCGAILGVAALPIRPLIVKGNSMAPTYRDGSLLWTVPVDRPLERGDVVVVRTPSGPVVKRIALLPGDRRYQWHSEDGWADMTSVALPHRSISPRRFRSITVPKGTVYLPGDNLPASVDSRSFGPVALDDVQRLVVDQRPPDGRAFVQLELPRAWLAIATNPKSRKG